MTVRLREREDKRDLDGRKLNLITKMGGKKWMWRRGRFIDALGAVTNEGDSNFGVDSEELARPPEVKVYL